MTCSAGYIIIIIAFVTRLQMLYLLLQIKIIVTINNCNYIVLRAVKNKKYKECEIRTK